MESQNLFIAVGIFFKFMLISCEYNLIFKGHVECPNVHFWLV